MIQGFLCDHEEGRVGGLKYMAFQLRKDELCDSKVGLHDAGCLNVDAFCIMSLEGSLVNGVYMGVVVRLCFEYCVLVKYYSALYHIPFSRSLML